MRKKLAYLTIVLLAVLYLGNPTETQYLQRIAVDFGQMHGGMEIAKEDLIKMGESSYESYFLFSFYSYRFGSIQVHYLGVGFQTFFRGSSRVIKDETLSV